jgi:hypothetical protein
MQESSVADVEVDREKREKEGGRGKVVKSLSGRGGVFGVSVVLRLRGTHG